MLAFIMFKIVTEWSKLSILKSTMSQIKISECAGGLSIPLIVILLTALMIW
jgi:hypothetical protein